MFIPALCVITQPKNNLRILLGKWLKKESGVPPYHGALPPRKRNELSMDTTTWMNLQRITLSERH
jgi:hypothetical protein